MKTLFKEYYSMNDEDIKNLWSDALFIFDTNILLNLYRYSTPTQNAFIDAMKSVKDRIWIPHQVAKEYHKNRLEVISEQHDTYKDFNKKIDNLIEELKNKKNPVISEPLYLKFESILSETQKELTTNLSSYELLFEKDTIREYITDLFDTKVGEAFSDDELKKLFKEGKELYLKKIPPGYKDNKKTEPEKYGDLILWRQIISKSKTDKKSIILILDDNKEDWWLFHKGKTISPRPELLREFRDKTNQQCYLYKPFQFLTYFNKMETGRYNEETIKEIENFELNKKKVPNQITLEIVLTAQLSTIDFKKYFELIEKEGYQITFYKIKDSTFKIIIILPNIPDLERRFRDRYLSVVSDYNLNLDFYSSHV